MKKLYIKINKIMTIIFVIVGLIFIGLLVTWAHFKQTKTYKELTPLTICIVIGWILTSVIGVITLILNQIFIHKVYFSKTQATKEYYKNKKNS